MGRTLNGCEVSLTKEQSFWKPPSNRAQPEGSKGSFAPAVGSPGILSSRISQWVPGWQVSTFELWCWQWLLSWTRLSCSHFADGNAKPARVDHSSGTGRGISLWLSHMVLVVPCLHYVSRGNGWFLLWLVFPMVFWIPFTKTTWKANVAVPGMRWKSCQ